MPVFFWHGHCSWSHRSGCRFGHRTSKVWRLHVRSIFKAKHYCAIAAPGEDRHWQRLSLGTRSQRKKPWLGRMHLKNVHCPSVEADELGAQLWTTYREALKLHSWSSCRGQLNGSSMSTLACWLIVSRVLFFILAHEMMHKKVCRNSEPWPSRLQKAIQVECIFWRGQCHLTKWLYRFPLPWLRDKRQGAWHALVLSMTLRYLRWVDGF